ncbi:MAG: hypothetical protein FJ318_03370 [SAR202 cluster bacterium]|nr:hypothetical protein [SAR202 cluster bacterium]
MDPYWYGGWNYAQAYSPLAYAVTGALALATPLTVETAYRLVLVVAVFALGVATYLLALEVGLRRLFATWAGLLVLATPPLFMGAGLYGWFSTLVALPFAIAGHAMLERAMRTRRRTHAAIAGALFGACVLASAMVGFSMAVALVPWLAYHLAASRARGDTARLMAVAGVAGAAVCGVWAAFFLAHALRVGFEREIPGIWVFNLDTLRYRIFARGFIGVDTYPTYLRAVQIAAGLTGAIHAVLSRSRLAGLALSAMVLAWLGLGAAVNPLINAYPLSGLDMARMSLLVMPLLAVCAASLLGAVTSLPLDARVSRRLAPVLPQAGVTALSALPVLDAAEAREAIAPVSRPAEYVRAARWIDEHTPPDAAFAAVGFRNWDAYWIPRDTGRRVMDGWHDEGTADWLAIREFRMMGWQGSGNPARLHEIMRERGVDYLVLDDWDGHELSEDLRRAVEGTPSLFERRFAEAGLTIFQRVDGR